MTVTEATTDKQAQKHSLLETLAQNELMRHVPSIEWMTTKLDGDIRRRVDILWAPVPHLSPTDPRRPAIESEFRSLCAALDRLAEVAKHIRNSHAPADLGSHVPWALNHAASCLRTVDPHTFGRRNPVQTHERSKSEPLYAAFLVVIQRVGSILPLVREVEPGVDEQLLAGLVKLETPLDDRMRTPIA
jgi:hypothetical protein